MEMALITGGQILSCTRFVLSTAEDNEFGKVALISFSSPLPHPEWAQGVKLESGLGIYKLSRNLGSVSLACSWEMMLCYGSCFGACPAPTVGKSQPNCVWNEFEQLPNWGAFTRSVVPTCWTFGHPFYAFVSQSTFCQCQRTSFQLEWVMNIEASKLCGMSLHKAMLCTTLICIKNTNYYTKSTHLLVQKQAPWQCNYFNKKNKSFSKAEFLDFFFFPKQIFINTVGFNESKFEIKKQF